MHDVILTMTQGAQKGREVRIALGHQLVIGRAYSPSGTHVVPHELRRALNEEDQRFVEEHLRSRAVNTRPGARSEVAAFERDEDLEVADEAVSQTHAILFVDEAGVSLLDVMSTNGTFINGGRCRDSALTSGDLIRVGETRLEVAFVK